MGKAEIRAYLRKIGRKGGKQSAKARLDKLTPERRSEIARKAALARWGRARKAGIASGKARSEKARRKGA